MSLKLISEYNQTYCKHTSCYYCLGLTLCYLNVFPRPCHQAQLSKPWWYNFSKEGKKKFQLVKTGTQLSITFIKCIKYILFCVTIILKEHLKIKNSKLLKTVVILILNHGSSGKISSKAFEETPTSDLYKFFKRRRQFKSKTSKPYSRKCEIGKMCNL